METGVDNIKIDLGPCAGKNKYIIGYISLWWIVHLNQYMVIYDKTKKIIYIIRKASNTGKTIMSAQEIEYLSNDS